MIEDPRPSDRGGVRLVLGMSPQLAGRLPVGASVAVSGVCLTVTGAPTPSAEAAELESVVVELAPETLARTTLGALGKGAWVNLEPALEAGDALGGHWVQGHVDTTLEVVERRDLEDHRELAFRLPRELAAYVVEKGSVALDGVSLTVASRGADRFGVALIPHTLEVTTLGSLEVGERVNLEVDVLAKYVVQYLEQTVEPIVERAVDRALAARRPPEPGHRP